VWSEVQRDWKDEVAVRFAHEYWEPLLEAINHYLKTLQELETNLDEAER
jgi:hypothetical protein